MDEWPAIGSRWREVDPRFDRVVVVVSYDKQQRKVGISTGGNLTWAKVERFNGKRGGYAKYKIDVPSTKATK